MTPEEYIKSISELVDARDLHRQALKLAQFRYYQTVVEALEAGISAHILAEICGCTRQAIYDCKKHYAVMKLQIEKEAEKYRADLASELAPDS